MGGRARVLFCSLGWLLLAGGCRRAAPAERVERLRLTPCHPEGLNEEARCGTLEVWEDRAGMKGRRFGLNVSVVSALAPSPAPDPVFVLAGGPGQGAAELMGKMWPMVQHLHRRRDIVFVDQRGTGKSSPLSCRPAKDAGLEAQFREDVDAPALQGCLAAYRDAGVDARRFTTDVAMDDLDDVRAALGYARINLFGLSYGTRAALVYQRQHPDRVRSLVLDGVVPPSMVLPVSTAEDADRIFERVFAGCEADSACASAFPGLKARFTALLARLAAHPEQVRLAHPVTGEPSSISLSRAGFLLNLHGMLYVPEISALLPLILWRASEGDFAPFVAQAYGSGAIGQSVYQGMLFSVVCAEDVPRVTPGELEALRKETYLRDDYARSLLEVCAFWPRGEVPAAFADDVRASTPALLLSGELDPVTPPRWAEVARAGLSRATHLVVPGAGHNTSTRGCVPRLVSQFIDRGDGDALETECVKRMAPPPFFVSFAGPSP